MFAKLFRRKSDIRTSIIVAHIAARLQPVQRGEFFEDPLDASLVALGLGSVTGGRTELADDPIGIRSCDVEISPKDTAEQTIREIINILERLGAPKGSEIRIQDQEPVPFGVLEGMAVLLDGTGLPRQVYEQSDINSTLAGLSKALLGKGQLRGHWEGSRETSLYFYGASFAEMRDAATTFASADPLCAQCRIEQIA